MRIHKQELYLTERQTVKISKGFKILSIGLQLGNPVIWYEENTELEQHDVFIKCYGTGFVIPKGETYIGTIQTGAMVWHFYHE